MDREILYRFFEGKTSESEEIKIKSWIETSDENKKQFFHERVAYDATLLTSFENLNKKRKVISILFWKISTIAAVFLLLIVSTLYVFIIKNSEQEQYNTVLVPPGQRINIVLSDNSNIWLNANTTFKYPNQFSKKNRTVYLDGEAYFDVNSNDKLPFIVETDYGIVQATGTSFNVEAYSKHNQFETSLFKGIVDVQLNNQQQITLAPDQNSKLKDGELLVSGITDNDKYLWRRGLIAFNDNKLEEILHSLEKYFDVNIQIDSSRLPEHTYTGKFRQSDGVDYALRVLQRSIRFKYKRDDDSGIIYINNN